MNWRFDKYGEICTQWWLESVNDLHDGESPISKILIGGLDGDICLHVVQVDFDGDYVQDALGYPTEDNHGVPFLYPEHVDLLEESEELIMWGVQAGFLDEDDDEVDEDDFEMLSELFIALHNYELKRSLANLEARLLQDGVELDDDFEAGLAHHDDEDTETVDDERAAVLDEMSQFDDAVLEALLHMSYANPARVAEWLR